MAADLPSGSATETEIDPRLRHRAAETERERLPGRSH